MTNCLDAWSGEDGNMMYQSGSLGTANQFNLDTTAGHFPSYVRCGLNCGSLGGNAGHNAFRLWPCGGLTTFWCSHMAWVANNAGSGVGQFGAPFLSLLDTSGNVRIALSNINYGGMAGAPFGVYKVTAGGTYTLLGTSTSEFSSNPSKPDKVDIYCNYGTSGTITIWINKVQVFTYSGNLQTDSNTTIGGTNLGSGNNGCNVTWSCNFVCDGDTRDLKLASGTLGAGTLDQWTGSVSNVNQTTVNDANYDYPSATGQVQRYGVTWPSLSPDVILAVIKHARATTGGGTTITHLDFVDLISGTQYVSADQAMPGAFGDMTYIENSSPAGGSWTVLPTEIGLESRP